MMMKRAALLLLPPVSAVLVVVAVRWLCRRLLLLASSSFRYCLPSPVAVEIIKKGGELPPVALYTYRRRRIKEQQQEEEEEWCVLCLSGISEGSEVRELRCRYLFHRPCLDRWLLATCPLCRRRRRLTVTAAEDPPYDVDQDYSDSDMHMMI